MNIKKILIAFLMLPILAFAWQPDPQKPITVLVPNTPGSGNELAFRTLASIIAKTDAGPKFVIVNQPGADGVVALNNLMTLPADGHSIIATSYGGMYLTNDIWEKNVKKFQWDSFPFTLNIGKSPLVLVASVKSPVNTPEEFIRLISTSTRPINVAVGGGAHRTVFEFLMAQGRGNPDIAKVVKFQGPVPAVTSVAQYDGSVGTEFGIMPIAIAQPLIRAGKVKPIGFSGTQKMPQYPTVPVMRVNNQTINITAAWTITMPPNTPREVVDWYVRTFAAASRTKEYQEWCLENVVYINDAERTPTGVFNDVKKMRETFLPLLEKIDLSKE